MKPKSNFDVVLAEALTAYKDCHSENAKGERDLNYRASLPVTGEEYVRIMERCTPEGYNLFDKVKAENVRAAFGDKAKYFIAREGSVCVYIQTQFARLEGVDMREFRSDAFSFVGKNTFRVWWD